MKNGDRSQCYILTSASCVFHVAPNTNQQLYEAIVNCIAPEKLLAKEVDFIAHLLLSSSLYKYQQSTRYGFERSFELFRVPSNA